MLPLDRIPLWSNWERRRLLSRVRSDLDAYFAALTYEAFPFRVVESDEARRIRENSSGSMRRCRRIVRASGQVSLVRLAPGERAGDVERVDLLEVVFELDRHNLRKEDVFQALDAATQAYERGARAAWLRTFNPLYWLSMGLDVVEVAPFFPLRLLGIEPGRVADSAPGTVVRVLLRSVALATVVVVGIVALGLQEPLLQAGCALLDRTPWLAAILKKH